MMDIPYESNLSSLASAEARTGTGERTITIANAALLQHEDMKRLTEALERIANALEASATPRAWSE